MDDAPAVQQEEKKKPQAIGPFVAVFIIVFLFAIGGIYFFIKQEQRIRTERQVLQQPENS